MFAGNVVTSRGIARHSHPSMVLFVSCTANPSRCLLSHRWVDSYNMVHLARSVFESVQSSLDRSAPEMPDSDVSATGYGM